MITKDLLVHELNMVYALNAIDSGNMDKVLRKVIPKDAVQVGTKVIGKGLVSISLISKKFKDEDPIKIKKLLDIKVETFEKGMEAGKDCTEPKTGYIIPYEMAENKGYKIIPDHIYFYININGTKKYINEGTKILTAIDGSQAVLTPHQFEERFKC